MILIILIIIAIIFLFKNENFDPQLSPSIFGYDNNPNCMQSVFAGIECNFMPADKVWVHGMA